MSHPRWLVDGGAAVDGETGWSLRVSCPAGQSDPQRAQNLAWRTAALWNDAHHDSLTLRWLGELAQWAVWPALAAFIGAGVFFPAWTLLVVAVAVLGAAGGAVGAVLALRGRLPDVEYANGRKDIAVGTSLHLAQDHQVMEQQLAEATGEHPVLRFHDFENPSSIPGGDAA